MMTPNRHSHIRYSFRPRGRLFEIPKLPSHNDSQNTVVARLLSNYISASLLPNERSSPLLCTNNREEALLSRSRSLSVGTQVLPRNYRVATPSVRGTEERGIRGPINGMRWAVFVRRGGKKSFGADAGRRSLR